MYDYQERVIKEKQELDAKLDKLAVFLKSVRLKTMSEDEQERMHRQFVIMNEYSEILDERIKFFPSDAVVQ